MDENGEGGFDEYVRSRILLPAQAIRTCHPCNLAFSMALNIAAIVLAMTGILDPAAGSLVHNAFGFRHYQFGVFAELEEKGPVPALREEWQMRRDAAGNRAASLFLRLVRCILYISLIFLFGLHAASKCDIVKE